MSRYNHFYYPAPISHADEATLLRSRHPYFPMNLMVQAAKGKKGMSAVLAALRVLRKFGGFLNTMEEEEVDNFGTDTIRAMGRSAKGRTGLFAVEAALFELQKREGWISLPCRDVDDTWSPSMLNLTNPKIIVADAVREISLASRGGPKPRYDGERLKEEVAAHVKVKGPFPYPESLVEWCSKRGRIKLRAGKRRPKDRSGKPNKRPDPHTVKDLIKKYGIASMKGVIVNG